MSLTFAAKNKTRYFSGVLIQIVDSIRWEQEEMKTLIKLLRFCIIFWRKLSENFMTEEQLQQTKNHRGF